MAVTPDGQLHTFDDEGSAGPGERILGLVDGRRTVGQIVEVLLSEYEVDRSDCVRDTKAFVEALIARRVLSFA
ncbi:MAG: PqqD family protein [Deltaproteobacteria bacterium]|nr:PqqD family protein [Deltaproteobacteria bacterium]